MKRISNYIFDKICNWIGNLIAFVWVFWWILIPLYFIVHGFFEDEPKKDGIPSTSGATQLISKEPVLTNTTPTRKNDFEYIKENNYNDQTFHDDECTEDCSGHEAGYNWAEENGISDTSDCDNASSSFTEGCETYLEENN